MSVTTISTTLTSPVTLGAGTYGVDVTITNTGAVVTNSGTAVSGSYTMTLDNFGTIIGNGQFGVGLKGAAAINNASAYIMGGYMGVDHSGVFVNAGTVIGDTIGVDSMFAQYGAQYSLTKSTLINSGTIHGGQTGVAIYYGTMTNTGDIYGGVYGINATNGGHYNAGLYNAGSIGGGRIGVYVGGGAIFTSGTISGAADAIYDKSGPGLGLTIAAGAVFTGDVFDRAGDGLLLLAGSTAGSINLDSTFIGFSAISFAPGSSWTLEGAGFELTLGQTIEGFDLNDKLVLDGFAATGDSFVTGAGLVLSNASQNTTLNLTHPLPSQSFSTTTDGTNTTIVLEGSVTPPLISIISTLYANQVTPGAGNYSSTLTITNDGTISVASGIALLGGATLAPATITNAGIIISQHGNSYAVSLQREGSTANELINTGTISGGGGVQLGTNPLLPLNILVNDGVIIARHGAGLEVFQDDNSAATIYNAGTIAGGYEGVLQYGLGAVTNAGLISGRSFAIEAKDSLSLIVEAGARFAGRVTVGGGGITLAGSAAGTLDMGTSFSGFDTIAFDSGVDWQLEGGKAELAAGKHITGFTLGDTIVLDNFAATGSVFAGGAELILTNSTASTTLGIAGNFSTSSFLVTDNAHGGTDISILCYLRGTRLMAPDGERLVEDLAIGDALITRFGGVRRIKWIGEQKFLPAFAGRHKTPVRIAAGALGNGLPRRDLFVSPGHSVLLDNRLILARNLVNGVSITQTPAPDIIEYFLIEFDTHDCVLAEGLWAESYADGPGLRAQFHNVAAFHALYPDYVTPDALALCAPRPESGPELAAVLAPVMMRAAAGLAPGRLRGFIDILRPDRIEGWAQDEAHPELPVMLMVFDGGTLLGMALACDYRNDLAAAGIGSGHCHFRFELAQPPQNALRVFRSGDGAEIFATQDCRRAA